MALIDDETTAHRHVGPWTPSSVSIARLHLNTVLLRTGFLALDDPRNTGDAELFQHVDWSRFTRAYSMGINRPPVHQPSRPRGRRHRRRVGRRPSRRSQGAARGAVGIP